MKQKKKIGKGKIEIILINLCFIFTESFWTCFTIKQLCNEYYNKRGTTHDNDSVQSREISKKVN